MKRTFIAVKIPFSKEAVKLFNDIKSDLVEERITWVDSSNLHITLFFLGDTKEGLIPEICNELIKCFKDVNPVTFTCKGLGVFKNINDPRVIWFGVENADKLIIVKKKVDSVLQKMGFNMESREFKPHLTLGRIKGIKNKIILKKTIEKFRDYKLLEVYNEEVIFYESIHTPRGYVYKELKTFRLIPKIES